MGVNYDLGMTTKQQVYNLINFIPYHNKLIEGVIKKIKQTQITEIKEDTLGVLFEKLIREQERKNSGQFYTPQEIVNYMVDFLNIKPESTILDPTCGCGVFLVTAHNYLRKINQNAIQNIYGVDLNNSATKIARINLWLRNSNNSNSLKILEKNIKTGNSVVENKIVDKKAFNWNKEFSEILGGGGFDFIVGNPPYVTLKNKRDYDIKESIFSKIANGSTNAASLVIAKSFELLKEGGVMAFVLPKTLIRVNSYSRLRGFLFENSKILHIYDLGSYFKGVKGEQIILFIQKTTDKNAIKENKVLIKVRDKKEDSLGSQKTFYIPQKTLKKYNTLLMFEDEKYYTLVKKIKGENLENIAKIFRGITISPNSEIISKSTSKQRKPIIKGNNISKFFNTNGFFIDVVKLTGNLSKLKYLEKDKIILQNIFSSESGIISCIDKKGQLTYDTVTNVVLTDSSFNLEYVFGLLNSKLLNFYLKYAVYNKSKLTMHTDKAYIGKIPIKKADKETQKEIIKLVQKINSTKDKKDVLREVDKKVYVLYKINKKEQTLIDKALEKTMSKKSLWYNGGKNE
ncbi:MAG: hypothetical protein CVU81_00390 [Euryarchaeota archaeon HGW-Euryarchaeota-1]|nr:MAG: hypothetical protein CVU81_00390 [Euryarchaeota archaeon HGW-Euryarchaeota-1]